MSERNYIDSILREEWDDSTRPGRYRAWDALGNVTVDRPFNPTETARFDDIAAVDKTVTNRRTLDQRANAAMQANSDYLAQPTHTNLQVAKQVEDLTKQNNGIIRLLTNRLDATD